MTTKKMTTKKMTVKTIKLGDRGETITLNLGTKEYHVAEMSSSRDGQDKTANEIAKRYNAYDGMLMELKESLKDLENWDGTPDTMDILKRNIQDRITKAKG